MNADTTFPALSEMMATCFHQDMDLEAETVPEAVSLYGRGLSADLALSLKSDIDRFRQQHRDDLDAAFEQAFGDDLDPRDAGFVTGDFLGMVEAVIADPQSFRRFLDEDMRPEFPRLRHLARACLDLLSSSAEARRLDLPSADSLPQALSIHLRALPATETQALLGEVRQFEDLYRDRASEVFGRRWLALEAGGFEGFGPFRQAVELISADPETYRNFVSA